MLGTGPGAIWQETSATAAGLGGEGKCQMVAQPGSGGSDTEPMPPDARPVAQRALVGGVGPGARSAAWHGAGGMDVVDDGTGGEFRAGLREAAVVYASVGH